MNVASDKRQFQRIAIARAAQLSSLRLTPLDCEIVDYCPQGVMIQIPELLDTTLAALLHQRVTLKFSASQDYSRIHRFSGKVVRAVPGALGIEVARFHPDTYQELTRSSAPDATTDTQPPIADRAQEQALISLCQTHFTPFMTAVITAFQPRLEATFEAASMGVISLDERWAYTSAPEVMRAQQHKLERAFLQPDYWRQTLASQNDTALEADALSLVEVDDFEDWLNLAQVIQKLEFEFKTDNLDCMTRYNRLTNQAITLQNTPCSPHILLSTFRSGLAGQDFTLHSKALLYQAFGAVLSEHYSAFYRNLLAELPQPATRPKTPKKSTPAVAESTSEPLPVTPVDAGVLDYKLDHIMRHLNLAQTPLQNQPAHHSAQLPEQNMLRTTGSLLTSLQHLRADQAGQRLSAEPSAAEQQIVLTEILNTLGQLPASAPEGSSDAPSIRQRLMAALPHLEASTLHSDQHVQTVELFDALLSQPLAESHQDSDIVALLKKLELPLLKLALTEEHFLGSDTHSARHTVNLFERFYVAADDLGKVFDAELLNLLNGLANRVVNQFETHPDVFDEVNGILEKLLAPLEEARHNKATQLHLNAEAQENIQQAREQVDDLIDARLSNRSLPTLVLALLDAVWRRHLQLFFLRHNGEHPEFNQALDLLDTLSTALTDAHDQSAHARHSLIAALMSGLKAVLYDPAQIESWASVLNASLNSDAPNELARYPAHPACATDLPGENSALKLVHQGDWISLNHSGYPVPYQMIWNNPARSRFMLINRSATLEHTLDRATLADSLDKGDALPQAPLNTPFMQRSAHSVMLNAYERLYQQAIHDPESQLLNRKGLMNLLNKLFIPGLREAQSGVLCLLVFDQLKAIHQSCEPAEAEDSLRELTARMRLELRANDAFSRLGEDTFVILFNDRPLEEVHAITLDMLARIAQHRVISAEKRFAIGVNVGLAELDAHVESASGLLKNAASACVVAKSHGVNSVQIYQRDSAQIQDDDALFEWAGLIDKALSDNLMYLRCQKIQPIDARAGHLPHYEILLGLDESLNTNPQGFVRAAEKWQRSADLDLWVVRTAFAWIQQHADELSGVSGFSINLSGLSLINQSVLDTLTQALGAADFPVDKIIFEITETAAIESLAAAQDFIARVKALGCRVSLDDFGSGYSSFAYLKNLDVDYLKIDGAFVRDILKDKADRAMVKSMHDVGQALGLKTIAEYVENEEILNLLGEIGVNYAQGWGVAKPIRLDSLQLN